jgi:hypothetical protein
MAAVIKGTTVIWSVDGIVVTGILAGIEQSFSRSVSGAQKEIMGDAGECVTKVYSNAKADLSIEVVPAARAAFPVIGTTVTITSAQADIKGAHSGKYVLTGGSQESTVDGETRYTFEAEQYIATALAT